MVFREGKYRSKVQGQNRQLILLGCETPGLDEGAATEFTSRPPPANVLGKPPRMTFTRSGAFFV